MVINTTQHTLTSTQIETITKNGYGKIIELKDFAPKLFTELSQTPSDTEQLYALVDSLSEAISDIRRSEGVTDEISYVHLPVGSPAFMFAFALKKGEGYWATNVHYVFSHSERRSIEETLPSGEVVKKAIFEFKKFIEFKS